MKYTELKQNIKKIIKTNRFHFKQYTLANEILQNASGHERTIKIKNKTLVSTYSYERTLYNRKK